MNLMNHSVDTLMHDACRALAATAYGKSERLCECALDCAMVQRDYPACESILRVLQECRRQRRIASADCCVRLGTTNVLTPEDVLAQGGGLILVTAPWSDETAGVLRHQAREQDIPVVVVSASNTSDTQQWTLTAGKVEVVRDAPPEEWLERPLCDKQEREAASHWFIESSEALGDQLLELALKQPPIGCLTALRESLFLVDDHEKMLQTLARQVRYLMTAIP